VFTAVDDAHDVTLPLAQAARLHDGHFTVLVVNLGQILAQASGSRACIQISLHNDASCHNVEAATESQQ